MLNKKEQINLLWLQHSSICDECSESDFKKHIVDSFCVDCDCFNSDIFTVIDSLWEKYGVGKKQLCIHCFSKRLGRPLHVSDLQKSPCDQFLINSGRIISEKN